MDRNQFINKWVDALEYPRDTISETTKLNDISWDSLSIMTTIGFIDEHYGLVVNAGEIKKCVTVADIIDLTEKTGRNGL